MSKEETGWLLEWDGPTYWTAKADIDAMTANHLKAVRFARREDAERVQPLVLGGSCRVVEHLWMGNE